MRVHIPDISSQTIGGGHTFYRNFLSALAKDHPDIRIVAEEEPHDILFACAVTMVSGETIKRSKMAGAKFVLRMDGVPEDSRNSGSGTRKLLEFSRLADYIIYQSHFIKETVGKLLRANGAECPDAIVPNGVDLDVFRPDGEIKAFPGQPKILHIAYRKDPNKRYEEVVAMYREYFCRNREANLLLLGRYPTEWMDHNMGFFGGERYQRLGVITDPEAKAAAIRSCDFMFYPSFADPAPNAVLEVLACGLPVLYQPYGGVEEMVRNGHAGLAIDYTKNFTQQIEELLDDRVQFGETARMRAENHGLPSLAAGYRHVFESALTP